VTLFYHGNRSRSLWVDERGHPDQKAEDRLAWDHLEANGRKVRLSDPETEDGLCVLRFEQDGTHISIFSNLPRPELIDLATSFVRAVAP